MGKARALLFFGMKVEQWENQNFTKKDSEENIPPEAMFNKNIGDISKECEVLCLTQNYLEDVFNYYIIVNESRSEVLTGKDGLRLTYSFQLREDWAILLKNIAEKLQISSQPPSWFLYCEERRSCCS